MKIVIVQPFIENDEKTRQLEAEAVKYVTERGYEPVSLSPNELAAITYNGVPVNEVILRNCTSNIDVFNANLFVIGLTSIFASMAGAVCFWEGWKDKSYCQDIYNIAFRNGLDIVLKPSEA